MDAVEALLDRLRRRDRVWVDALLLFFLFAGVNFLTAGGGSLGWMGVNPNPYLLIPVLIGGRYGSGAGLYCAGASVLLLTLFAYVGESALRPEVFLSEHAVLLFAFFIFALAAGEVQTFYRKKADRLEVTAERHRRMLRVLDHDIQRVARVNRELQERLLVSDNRIFSVDMEIRALYECREDELWDKALAVLEHTEELAAAAIYGQPEADGKLPRKSSIGGDDRFTAQLDPARSPLLGESLKRREMVMVADLLSGDGGAGESFLLAKPFYSRDRELIGVLVVSRLPFLRLNAETLSRIDLTMDWMGEIIALRLGNEMGDGLLAGPENKRLLSLRHFRKMLALSVEAWARLRVPSGVVVLRTTSAKAREEGLAAAVNRRVRAGDFLSRVEGGVANAIVLLPFTSVRGVEIFVESCRKLLAAELPGVEVEITILQVADFTDEEEVWGKIGERILHGGA